MFSRLIALGAAATALIFCLFVFDAASAAKTSNDLIDDAAHTQSPEARRLILSRVHTTFDAAWSRPLAWHAGALELASGADAALAQSAEDPALAQSVDAAEASLHASPVQPLAWLRLAALARYGHPNALCDEQRCLELSWAAGPVLDADDACLRLELASAAGLSIASSDARIKAFLAASPGQRQLLQCLSFLPAEQQFSLILDLRQQGLARRQARLIAPEPRR